MLQTKKGTCARQGLGPHPLAPRSTAFTQRHAKNPELQGGKRGRGERVGCAAQMAPARGERPGIHTKAAGFNYQLASPGRARGCAVNLPLFPCPLPSLDFASPPDAFGAASALAGSIAAFRQCRAMLPRGDRADPGVPPPSDTGLCSDEDPQLQLAVPGETTWSSLCPGHNRDPSVYREIGNRLQHLEDSPARLCFLGTGGEKLILMHLIFSESPGGQSPRSLVKPTTLPTDLPSRPPRLP